MLLDPGFGPKDQAEPVAFLGHKNVGVNLDSDEADALSDAHSLPFNKASFDFVLSYAAMEHFHSPFLAMREVEYVLKPKGIFCGAVWQGEPFHHSYFHHTMWGLQSVAYATGLEVLKLWSCWDTLSALSSMGRYPRVIWFRVKIPHRLHEWLSFLAPRKMNWSSKK